MFEFETKILLTQKEYQILCRELPVKEPVLQINYYYDTPELKMNSAGVTCRIRKKNGRCTATVKTHCAGEKERSAERTKEVRDECDVSAFSGMGMILHGSLHTQRTSVDQYPGIKIELDKNTYLGITDYELEIEYTPEFKPSCELALNHIAELLKYPMFSQKYQAFISRVQKTKSKSQRFFEWKELLGQKQAAR